MIVITPLCTPLVDTSEFSVFKASPLDEIAFIVPDSIVIESFPFRALLGAFTSRFKFLISKSFVVPIALL